LLSACLFCGFSNLLIRFAFGRARSVTVYLGALDVSQTFDSARQSFQSTSIYNHPQYSSLNRNIDFDIAVVRLPSPAAFNSEQLDTESFHIRANNVTRGMSILVTLRNTT
jgi:Trypsin